MLPIVYSFSLGHVETIPLDLEQRAQLLMTLGQALVGLMFLLNMSLAWWEAAALLALFLIPFAHPAAGKLVTVVYFAWAGIELIRIVRTARMPPAVAQFASTWKAHVTK
jgi:cation:H+ antiporter